MPAMTSKSQAIQAMTRIIEKNDRNFSKYTKHHLDLDKNYEYTANIHFDLKTHSVKKRDFIIKIENSTTSID